MAIKTYKPTTPSRRHMTSSGFEGVEKHVKPERSLIATKKKHSGRNSYGRITVRHTGGGNRQKYRIIDFKRTKMDVEAPYCVWNTTPTVPHSSLWLNTPMANRDTSWLPLA